MIVRTSLTRVTVTYQDAEFTFRELSTYEEAGIAVEASKDPGAGVRRKFIEPLVEWRGVIGPEGVELECNAKNKMAVFDANQELVEDVLTKYVAAMEKAVEAEKKILMNGQDGT